MTAMIWLYVAAGFGVVFVAFILLVGFSFAWDAVERLRSRWSVLRKVVATDWAALRESFHLAVAHWRQTNELLDAAERRKAEQRRGQ
jgi:hypothetical protein